MASSDSTQQVVEAQSASIEVKDRFPLEKIGQVQALTAKSFEAAYLAAGDFPDLSKRIRMNAVECREQQTTVHTLVLKFRNTGNDVLDMLVPQIRDAVEEGDAELVKLNLELAVEWTVEMKTDCENTRKEYCRIRGEVNESLAEAKDKKVENDKDLNEAERKQATLAREKKQLAEEEIRLQGLMNQLDEELKAATTSRLKAQTEQEIAHSEAHTETLGFWKTMGRIFKPDKFKTRLEIANEQLDKARDVVFQAHKKVQELSTEVRDSQWKINQHVEKIRNIQDDKKVLGDQSHDLQRASEGLGKVDYLLQMCSDFWGAMNNACATMQRKLENPQKTFLKRDLRKYKKQFLKTFEDGIEFWKVFVDVSEKYLTQGGSAAAAYKFLDGTVDHVSKQQREARLQILQEEVSSLELALPEADSYAAIMYMAQEEGDSK